MTRLGVSERLDRWPTLWVGAVTLVMASLVGWADLVAGTDVSATLFFLIPIWFASWYGGRAMGVGVACACSLARLGAILLEGHLRYSGWVLAWNTTTRSCILILFAFLFWTLRRSSAGLAAAVVQQTASFRNREKRMLAIIQTVAEGIITADTHGTVESLNPTCERMFAYKADEIIGQRIETLLPLLKQRNGGEGVHRDPVNGEVNSPGEAQEVEGCRKDRTMFPVELSVSEFVLNGHRKQVWVVRDITTRKHNEEIRNRLAAIVECTSDPIISNTPDDIIATWNAGAEAVFGYTAAEAIGKSVTMLVPPELADEETTILERWRSGERVENLETVRLHRNGRRIRVSLNISLLRNAAGKIIGSCKVVRDITARAELESAVVAATEEDRGRIARDLHDGLGQQLTAAMLQSDLLERDLQARSGVDAARATQIHELISSAISQVREVARGLYPVPPEPDGLMRALQSLTDYAACNESVACEFNADSVVLLSDRTVAAHLYRIAQEALNNALKYSGARRIEIRLVSSGPNLELIISDDGKGLPGGAERKGLGLKTMADRARMIGGRFAAENGKRGGVRISCAIKRARLNSVTVCPEVGIEQTA